MKKIDIMLTISILLIAGGFFVFNQYKADSIEKNSNGLVVEISVKGELYKIVPLTEEEHEFVIETDLGKNVIRIHDRGVEVVEADCNDHICEETGFIDKAGEIIVCLPNKVVVEIKGNIQEEIDGLSS